MKLLRKITYAFVALTLCLGLTSCNNDDEVTKNYSKDIIGMWLNFDNTNKIFLEFYEDGTFKATENTNTLTITTGTYVCNGDILIAKATGTDGNNITKQRKIEIEGTTLTIIDNESANTKLVLNRVKRAFNILNRYKIYNVIPQIEAKEGDHSLVFPEGITYKGQDRVPTTEMGGTVLAESARKYFSEILFNENGTLSHTFEGQTLNKPYTFGKNKLTVSFQPDSKVYNLEADIFPNESEDRLFIVIPNQRNWGAVFMSLLKREDPSLTITDEKVEAMCDEHENTFDTFTLILSYDIVK